MTVRFGASVLDRERRELRRGGEAVHLTPKAFELLLTLLERRPRLNGSSTRAPAGEVRPVGELGIVALSCAHVRHIDSFRNEYFRIIAR